MPEAKNSSKNNGKSYWQYLDDLDNYNYVVTLNSPQFQNINRFFMHRNNNYELVYADNLNSIYLKNNKVNEVLISKYSFKNNGEQVYHEMQKIKPPKIANIITTIFNPFYSQKNISNKNNLVIGKQQYFNYINAKF